MAGSCVCRGRCQESKKCFQKRAQADVQRGPRKREIVVETGHLEPRDSKVGQGKNGGFFFSSSTTEKAQPPLWAKISLGYTAKDPTGSTCQKTRKRGEKGCRGEWLGGLGIFVVKGGIGFELLELSKETVFHGGHRF